MSEARAKTADYRELLARYGRTHWWTAGMQRITLTLVGRAQGRWLDIGCGPGWLLSELPHGLRGFGVDLYVHATRYRPLVRATACRLPFRDAGFDVVTALDVLEQEDVDPAPVLVEARRVLRPGGRLLVRVPAYPGLFGPHDRLWGGARRFRREELAALMADTGWTVQRLTYANSLLLFSGVAVRLLERTGWLGGNDLRPLPAPLNTLLLGVMKLEARWLRSRDFRAGLSLICLAQR